MIRRRDFFTGAALGLTLLSRSAEAQSTGKSGKVSALSGTALGPVGIALAAGESLATAGAASQAAARGNADYKAKLTARERAELPDQPGGNWVLAARLTAGSVRDAVAMLPDSPFKTGARKMAAVLASVEREKFPDWVHGNALDSAGATPWLRYLQNLHVQLFQKLQAQAAQGGAESPDATRAPAEKERLGEIKNRLDAIRTGLDQDFGRTLIQLQASMAKDSRGGGVSIEAGFADRVRALISGFEKSLGKNHPAGRAASGLLAEMRSKPFSAERDQERALDAFVMLERMSFTVEGCLGALTGNTPHKAQR